MTYEEFYHLQIGDVVTIHSGDSFSAYVVIIINPKLQMVMSVR
jgi:flagellar motor switch protein FliM